MPYAKKCLICKHEVLFACDSMMYCQQCWTCGPDPQPRDSNRPDCAHCAKTNSAAPNPFVTLLDYAREFCQSVAAAPKGQRFQEPTLLYCRALLCEMTELVNQQIEVIGNNAPHSKIEQEKHSNQASQNNKA